MAVLSHARAATAAASMLAQVGCYAPELADCRVTCAANVDCAPTQICGSDGRCAAPDVAGQCASIVEPPDAPPVDARPLDAPTPVNLTIKIGGRGRVVIDDNLILTCAWTAPGHQCMFTLEAGITTVLRAYPDLDQRFDKWADACSGSSPACTLITAPPSMLVEAKFKGDP